jgi:SHS2 domain-containing protein
LAELVLEPAGATLPELFQDAAGRLLPQLIDPTEVGSVHREKIVVEAETPKALLTAWIDALIALPQAQAVLFHHCENPQLEETPLGFRWTCDLVGELVDRQRHRLSADGLARRCVESRLTAGPPWRAVIRLA